MKKLLVIGHWSLVIALLLTGMMIQAQDRQLLAERDLIGSARYVGMAGAMTAIGGDPSAVVVNPAGLGVYRRLETMITLDLQLDQTRQYGDKSWTKSAYFIPTQVSAVFSLINENKTEGVIAHNFMISYNRLKTWHRTYNGSGVAMGSQSIAQWMANDAYRTNGTALRAEDFEAENWADDEDISWLTEMGYQQYMIDDPDGKAGHMVSQIDPSQWMGHALRVEESGYVNEFNLHWAMNIDNRYFFGLGLGVQTLYHLRYSDYAEAYDAYYDDGKQKVMTQSNYLRWNGVGINGAIGVILHPIRSLRVGLSFTTPTAMSLKTRNQGTMIYDAVERYSTPESHSTDKNFTQPLRLSAGIAWQHEDKGLISLQYDYAHHKGMEDVHTLRLGTEWRPKEKWYITAGYAIESIFRSTDYVYPLPHGSVRTDMDWKTPAWRQHACIGFGYRGTYLIAQMAYQCGWDKTALFATEALDNYDMRDMTHRVVFSFAFHTR